MKEHHLPRILLTAPGSGSGKTLLTCALLRLLQRKGYKPSAFKCGPDYIDPMFHKTVLGIPSRNLDLYMAGRAGVLDTLRRGSRGADLAVIEGVMGFFDGLGAAGTEGSTAETAAAAETPAVLVADVRGMSRSAVALVKGFADYDYTGTLKGVILNRVSAMLYPALKALIEEETDLQVLGFLPKLPELGWESRHLGLVEPQEIPDILRQLDLAADELERSLDLKALLALAETAPPVMEAPGKPEAAGRMEERAEEPPAFPEKEAVRIGIARDESFNFYYEDNLDLLRGLGAQLVSFSPLHDRELPEVDGLLIGGGYPELYAKELSANLPMKNAVADAVRRGMPVLAECGGFMYLQEELETKEGRVFPMTGVLRGRSRYTGKLVRFGYIEITGKTAYLREGEHIRGHEFHYFDSTDNGASCHAAKPSGRSGWDCIVSHGAVMAGYPHLYYPSAPGLAKSFIEACRRAKDTAGKEGGER